MVPTSKDQNSTQEEIESRMKSENACYYWVQNPLFLSLIFNSIWMKIYGTIILPAVFYRCETWSLTLREERRLRAFENRVLRTIL